MTDPNETEADQLSRRKTLIGIGAGAAGLVGVTGQAAMAPGNGDGNGSNPLGKWTQLQYDAAKTGRAPNEGVRKNPSLKWSFRPNEDNGHFRSGPVVADGMVYHSNDDITYALDAETGELQWSFPAANYYYPAAVHNGKVYFAESANTGQFYALDAKTGDVVWTTHSGLGTQSTGVTVANNTLYYGAHFDDGPHLTVALDPETGEERWRSSVTCTRAPAVKNGRLFGQRGAWRDAEKFALDAETGELLWTADYLGAKGTPTVAEGTVYWGTHSGYISFDAETGEKAFEGKYFYADPTATDSRHNQVASSLAYADGVLYGGTTGKVESSFWGDIDQPGSVYAFDAETGEEIWRNSNGENEYEGMFNNPALTRGVLYTDGERIGGTNAMWAWEAETGDLLWMKDKATAPGNSSPAVANGTVHIGGFARVQAIEEGE